jgi:hypothetical protein
MQSVKRVLRTPEAAEYVGLSASTLEKFRLSGEGPREDRPLIAATIIAAIRFSATFLA